MVRSIKWLEKQLSYLWVLDNLKDSNALRSSWHTGISFDVCHHQFMVVAYPSLNVHGKVSASWDWVSRMADSRNLLYRCSLCELSGETQVPQAYPQPVSGCSSPPTPVLTHFTTGGENFGSVAGQKLGPITICVMTQFVLLWVSVLWLLLYNSQRKQWYL